MTLKDFKNLSEKERLYFLLYEEEKYRDYLYSFALYLEKEQLWNDYAEKGIIYEFVFAPQSLKTTDDLKKRIIVSGYEIPNTDKIRLMEIKKEHQDLGNNFITYKYHGVVVQRLVQAKENLSKVKKEHLVKVPNWLLEDKILPTEEQLYGFSKIKQDYLKRK